MEEQSFSKIAQSLILKIDQKVESYIQHWINQTDDKNYRDINREVSEWQNDS